MGMAQVGQGASLAEKALHLTVGPRPMEHFDGRLRVQVHMLPQVDRPPVPLSQQLEELIGAHLLSYVLSHLRTSCLLRRSIALFPPSNDLDCEARTSCFLPSVVLS